MSFAAVSSALTSRSQTQTVAPLPTKARAISLPIPDPPAVIKTRRAMLFYSGQHRRSCEADTKFRSRDGSARTAALGARLFDRASVVVRKQRVSSDDTRGVPILKGVRSLAAEVATPDRRDSPGLE